MSRKKPEFDRTKLCEHCHEPFRQAFARHVFCDACAPEGKFSKFIRKYGIGHREWLAMAATQSGKCALCPTVLDMGKNTHIDHDHTTGRVRGLLCNYCNTRVGILENKAFVMKALVYLNECSPKLEHGTMDPHEQGTDTLCGVA